MPIVAVERKSSTIVGRLYFRTQRHVVLLNNIRHCAHLGRLRGRRRRHFDPEADVFVIPTDQIVAVHALGR
jgi:hypothetical protein